MSYADENTKPTTLAELDAEVQPAVAETRRRLLKGGLAGAPVLMTLASRPVLAGGNEAGGMCKSPSGFTSLKASQHRGEAICLGRTPGYWKQSQHFDDWTPPYYPTTIANVHNATLFHGSPTAGAGFNIGAFGDMGATTTLLDALGTGGNTGDYVALARHIAAALLNAAKGWNGTPSILDQTAVRKIWNDYVSLGYYSPVAGVQWDAAQIIAYLLTTMPL